MELLCGLQHVEEILRLRSKRKLELELNIGSRGAEVIEEEGGRDHQP